MKQSCKHVTMASRGLESVAGCRTPQSTSTGWHSEKAGLHGCFRFQGLPWVPVDAVQCCPCEHAAGERVPVSPVAACTHASGALMALEEGTRTASLP